MLKIFTRFKIGWQDFKIVWSDFTRYEKFLLTMLYGSAITILIGAVYMFTLIIQSICHAIKMWN